MHSSKLVTFLKIQKKSLLFALVIGIFLVGWYVVALATNQVRNSVEEQTAITKSAGDVQPPGNTESSCSKLEAKPTEEEGPDGETFSGPLAISAQRPITVEVLPRRKHAQFILEKSDTSYSLELISPSGKKITKTTDSYDVTVGDNDFGQDFSVYHPEAGTWQVAVRNGNAGAARLYVRQIDIVNKLPKAVIAKPTVVPVPPKLKQYKDDIIIYRFDAGQSYDPDGSIVDYIWSFGDGLAGEGKVVEHIFHRSTEEATCMIRLRVVDDSPAVEFSETTTEVEIPKR